MLGRLIFVKTSIGMKNCGINNANYQGINYKISSKERTLSDYLYLYVHGHITKNHINKMLNTLQVDKNNLIKILLSCYPKHSSKKMLSLIQI